MAFSFGNATNEYSGDFGSGKEEVGYSSLSFTPTAGFFVANGIAIGLIVDLTSTTYKSEEDVDWEETSTQYSVGPVFRYYTPGGFFVHGDVSFGKMIEKSSYDGDSDQDDADLLKWQVGVGYAFFLNDHVSIEPTMTYRNTQSKYEDEYETNKVTLGEFVIGVGLNIFLHKKL